MGKTFSTEVIIIIIIIIISSSSIITHIWVAGLGGPEAERKAGPCEQRLL